MKTVKELTIEQKLRLICGKDCWHTEDFGGELPYVRVTDASMGIRMPLDSENWGGGIKPSVSYPSMQVLASTWNKEIVRKYSECVADDCLDAGADVLLGPGINIKRNPLCGRNFEYMSEDPYLAGTIAREYVSGLQSEGAAACIKHFCCNNQENNRFNQTSEVDERTLREIYYKPFEIACEAKPVSLMSSYNPINGVLGSEYKKGYDVLRNEYGFDGLIMSDWDAVRDRTKAAKAGLDLEMPFHPEHFEQLVKDYNDGKITEEEITVLAERVLKFVETCKAMQKGKKRKHTLDERIAFTQTVEEEGIVLLKNEGVLPIKKGLKISACGIYGKAGDGAYLFAGGGSSEVQRLTPMFDIHELLQKEYCEVAYETAYGDMGVEGATTNPKKAVENAAASDINIVFVGTGKNIEIEARDRATLKLTKCMEDTILDTAAVNPNTVVVIFASSAIDMSAWIDEVAAVMYAGFPGERGGEAVVNVLCGKVNPSGKLTESFPLCYEDTPAANSYSNSFLTRYDEGIDVGYRYYNTYGVDVLFPFGYGLSYSEFAYKNLKLKSADGGIEVEYEIENVSSVDGKEISQVYIRPLNPSVYRPYKELKGFAKTAIKANGKAKVKVLLDKSAFAYWSTGRDCWYVEDGVYEIIVAASVSDEKLRARLTLKNGKIVV